MALDGAPRPGELVAEELEHAVHAFAEQAAKVVTA
jgi:hypothetical protein